MTTPTRLSTDFNSATEHVARVLVESVVVLPAVGDAVVLYDANDNTCSGVVERIDNGLIYVRPDWSTWTEASRFEPAGPVEDLVEALFAAARRTDDGVWTGDLEQESTLA